SSLTSSISGTKTTFFNTVTKATGFGASRQERSCSRVSFCENVVLHRKVCTCTPAAAPPIASAPAQPSSPSPAVHGRDKYPPWPEPAPNGVLVNSSSLWNKRL